MDKTHLRETAGLALRGSDGFGHSLIFLCTPFVFLAFFKSVFPVLSNQTQHPPRRPDSSNTFPYADVLNLVLLVSATSLDSS